MRCVSLELLRKRVESLDCPSRCEMPRCYRFHVVFDVAHVDALWIEFRFRLGQLVLAPFELYFALPDSEERISSQLRLRIPAGN